MDLVEGLAPDSGSHAEPEESQREGWEEESLRGVWEGEDQDECVTICERLKAAEIPFKVAQHRQQFLKGVDCNFKIGVPPKFFSEAKKMIEEDNLDSTDEEEDQRTVEPPLEDSMPDAQDLRKDAGDWEDARPHDATVEIWSEATPLYTEMIEASLGENNIHALVEGSANGSRRILVPPEDESRAREIVHEIKDATPP
ncbi:MAG TPA: hypothetical protein VKR82_16085 [Candidatus Acidoferrales bacterium]|nr:hypothetical protein [Candidatus Acidoferrales bacterium]